MLLDNKNHGKVISELRANIQPSTKLSVLCGLFSIYGYATLKKELASVSEARLIISRWDDSYLQTLSGQPSEMRLKNHLDQTRIAKECALWLQKQAQIKALLSKSFFVKKPRVRLNAVALTSKLLEQTQTMSLPATWIR